MMKTEKIFPFFWLKGDSTGIEAEIRKIKECGLHAFCVESRPHPDFCGEGWWHDLDVIFSVAEELKMQVWILDDRQYPTGFANGACLSDPDLRPWMIALKQMHFSGAGRQKFSVFLRQNESLLGAYLFCIKNGKFRSTPINLTKTFDGSFVYADVISGDYSVFFLIKTREGVLRENYIDVFDKDAVRVFLDTVYEPHYRRYATLIGNVFRGFFSDEPQFGNGYYDGRFCCKNAYEYSLGLSGMAYPFPKELFSKMSAADDPYVRLLALWLGDADTSGEIRCDYMNALTDLYEQNFTKQIGEWCHERGLEYAGHVIEDMNAHVRTGVGTGHYFKSQSGQSMAGIDVVLHQIKPKFECGETAAPIAGGKASVDFFRYTLPALAASAAILENHGNSLCEIFGAYGWGESVADMKWVLDLMLVNGINHFIPHAFSMKFPDWDCPPHFYAEGKNPQFGAFSALMKYASKMCERICGGEPIVDVGVLYHAESEWSGADYVSVDPILKRLKQSQINAIIVPSDRLDSVKIKCLIVPYTSFMPDSLLKKLQNDRDYKIIFMRSKRTSEYSRIIQELEKMNIRDIHFENKSKTLQYYHYTRDHQEFMLLFNGGKQAMENAFLIGTPGNFLLEDPFTGEKQIVKAESRVPFRLPSGGLIAVSRTDSKALNKKILCRQKFRPIIKIERKRYDEDVFTFIEERKGELLYYDREHDSKFSGTLRCNLKFEIKKSGRYLMSLPICGAATRAWVDERDLGWRLSEPYVYDLYSLTAGTHDLRFELSNTLADAVCDDFSFYQSIPCFGIGDDFELIEYTEKGE